MKAVSLEKIEEIINEVMEGDLVSIDHMNDDLTELGMDSLHFIQTVIALEETFECEFPDSILLISELNSVRKIYDVLQTLWEKQAVALHDEE